MSIFERTFFTAEHANILSSIMTLSNEVKFVVDNSKDILLRINTKTESENIDTFVMDTSSSPTDELVYTSDKDFVDLTRRDAGFF